MPAAKPAALKLLNGRGNGKDSAGRAVPTAPAFERAAPIPPEWLSEEARAEWDRTAPSLDSLDLLKPEDRATFAVFCETWATWVEAIGDVRRDGLRVLNRSIRKDGTESEWWTKNPSMAVAETAATQLRAYANDFGLSPAAERSISKPLASDGDGNADPFTGGEAAS